MSKNPKRAKITPCSDDSNNIPRFVSEYSHINVYLDFLKREQMNRVKGVLEEKGGNQKWLAVHMGKNHNMVNAYAQKKQYPRLWRSSEKTMVLGVGRKRLSKSEEASK